MKKGIQLSLGSMVIELINSLLSQTLELSLASLYCLLLEDQSAQPRPEHQVSKTGQRLGF